MNVGGYMEKNSAPVKIIEAVKTLKEDVEELEQYFEHWDFQSTSGGKKIMSIAKRIVNSAKRVPILVKENTYPLG